MPKISSEYRDVRRQEIIDAASRRFTRDGFDGASINDVSSESGRSASAIYLYFRNKDALIADVVSQTLVEWLEILTSFAKCTSFSDETAAELAFSHHLRDQNFSRNLMLEVWLLGSRPPSVATPVLESVESSHRVIARYALVALKRRGTRAATAQRQARDVARSLLRPCQGLVVQAAVLGASYQLEGRERIFTAIEAHQ